MSAFAAWWNSLPIGLTDALWTIAVGATASVGCALLGCYLVLRRLSLLGDAISHAILPGLVLGLLWTGTRNPLPMLLGAMAMGMATAFLTELFERMGRVPADSSMGVVFTSLFAAGVILINLFASQIDMDPGCVLYGLIEFVVFDTVELGGLPVPRALLTMSGMLALVLVFIALLWKELKLCSFDPALASAMGLSAGLVHYLLMAMVATATVASFEAVGSILVIAMLIVPGATAHLLTDRLGWMMALAAAVALISAVAGYLGAHVWNTSVAGMMAVAAGVQFALAALLAPRYGVLGRMLHNLSVGLRIAREDMLTLLCRRGERGREPALAGGAIRELTGDGIVFRLALGGLRRRGLVRVDDGQVALTANGARAAEEIIHAHRLWEVYMADELERRPEAVHEAAHPMEHFLPPELARQIDEHLNHPRTDPHGSRIPRQGRIG